MKPPNFPERHVKRDTCMVRPGLLFLALAIWIPVPSQSAEPAGKAPIGSDPTEQALNAHYTKAELERGVYVGSEVFWHAPRNP